MNSRLLEVVAMFVAAGLIIYHGILLEQKGGIVNRLLAGDASAIAIVGGAILLTLVSLYRRSRR